MIKPGDLCLVISGPATGCSVIAEGVVKPGQSEDVEVQPMDYYFKFKNNSNENMWFCSNERITQEVNDQSISGFGIFRQSQIIKITGDDERVKNREVVLNF